MGSIATAILAFYTAHANPGGSLYSFEELAACGSDPKAAACALGPVCEAPGPLCAAPRWSATRGAWVRVESRDAALRRYQGIAEALVGTASRLVTCRLPDGSVDFDCVPVRWGGGKGQVRELALFAATIVLHESGLREDVEIGAPPMGRGPAKESCLVQIMPDQIAANASWLSSAERKAAESLEGREVVAKQLLGRSPEALGRCFEVGMRIMARARSQCRGAGDAGVFSSYGTGACRSVSAQWVTDRVRTLTSLRAFVQQRTAIKAPGR